MISGIDHFLKLKLKLNDEEIKELGIVNITRPKKEDCDRLYLYMKFDEGPRYIFRKSAQVKNADIKISPYIPPQIYKRFSELSPLN